MAVIADKMYNLRDYAAQFGANGQELAIAEVLSQTNDIIADMPLVEGNSDAGHEFSVRTGIPKGTFRRAYKGIPPEKATSQVVLARFGTLSAYSVIDKLTAEKGGHVDAVRSGQSRAILSGMSNTMADAIIYGGEDELDKFPGLEAHYGSLSAKVPSSRNIVNAGGNSAAKNSSIYLVVWDTDKVFSFFPKGAKAGLERKDFGLVNHTDAEGEEYPAYKEYFEWKLGIAVQDWRYAGRICNINTADLANVDLVGLMQDLEEKIQATNVGHPVWYMNRTVRSALRKQLGNKANVQYTPDTPNAKPILRFSESPVHLCDAIKDTEAKLGA